MFYTFVTLEDFRHQLGLAPDETADDRRLMDLLTAASTGIEQVTGRRFLPRRAVFTMDAPPAGEPLLLPADLLELISLSDARGSLPGDEITIFPAEPPWYRVESASGWQWHGSRRDAITVTGIWGWHSDYGRAWLGSGDEVRSEPLTGSSSTVQVIDTDAEDVLGRTPRFQVGQIVRINDEYVQVYGRDDETNMLSILRAVSGTTNTVHSLYSSMVVYHPPPVVKQAALLWAQALYRGEDAPPPEALALIASLRRPHLYP